MDRRRSRRLLRNAPYLSSSPGASAADTASKRRIITTGNANQHFVIEAGGYADAQIIPSRIRHRLCARRPDAGSGRGTNEPRGRCEIRRHESRAAAAGLRCRFRCILSLPRWPGSCCTGRGDRGHSAGRIGSGRRSDRGSRQVGLGHGLYRDQALPALRGPRGPHRIGRLLVCQLCPFSTRKSGNLPRDCDE